MNREILLRSIRVKLRNFLRSAVQFFANPARHLIDKGCSPLVGINQKYAVQFFAQFAPCAKYCRPGARGSFHFKRPGVSRPHLRQEALGVSCRANAPAVTILADA